jgi:hypothetical protein
MAVWNLTQIVFVGFVWYPEKITTISAKSINRVIITMQTQFILCEIGIEFLSNVYISFMF